MCHIVIRTIAITHISKLAIVFFFGMALVSCKSNAGKIDNDRTRIESVCDKFMSLFSEGKARESLQLLKENTVMNPDSIDSLQVKIDEHITSYFLTYGKMLSYEFIVEHKIKDFLSKRLYVLKFEKYFLKFDFTIYKSHRGWTITNFNYNDELLELLY